MESVAMFPEGSTKLYATILADVGRTEEGCVAAPARDAVLAASSSMAKVAEGSFGKVYSLGAPDGASPKVVKQVTPVDTRSACNAMKEGILLSVLSAAGQDFIPTLRDCFLDGRSCYSVMDQAHKSLDAHLPIRGPAFTQSELGVLSVSLLAAVHGLHVAGLLHNDLKPKNLLLAGRTEAPTIQIVDLDAATLLGMPAAGSTGARNSNGTTAYLSPERLLTGCCSIQSDMWAVGVIIYELLEGRRKYPFNWQGRRMTASVMEDRIAKLATRGISLPSGLKSGPWGPLLQGLLHKDPARRWGIRECACFPGLQDAFFVEAAARAPPTHAALIQQLLAMRKVWQAATACWQHDAIKQSLWSQDATPPAALMAAPLQQIGQSSAEDDDDESDIDSDEDALDVGGVDDASAACLGASLAGSRAVSTIVFSSDDDEDDEDEDDDDDGSSGSGSGSSGSVVSSTGEQSGCGNDTCDQDEHAVSGVAAACLPGLVPTSDSSAKSEAAACDGQQEERQDNGSNSKASGSGGLPECLASSSPMRHGSVACAATEASDEVCVVALLVEATPRAVVEDDTRSSFKIAAAWPRGVNVVIDGAGLAAQLRAASAPSCAGAGFTCGQLLDACPMAKMYIKSTLTDAPSPCSPLFVAQYT